MYEWYKNIQKLVDEIDLCIKMQNDEALTLKRLSHELGYSEFYISRKFKEISGMQFRDYLRYRRLAFALKKTYFVTIPAHKFLHIRNYESIGYWDF